MNSNSVNNKNKTLSVTKTYRGSTEKPLNMTWSLLKNSNVALRICLLIQVSTCPKVMPKLNKRLSVFLN